MKYYNFLLIILLTSCSVLKTDKETDDNEGWHESWILLKETEKFKLRINTRLHRKIDTNKVVSESLSLKDFGYEKMDSKNNNPIINNEKWTADFKLNEVNSICDFKVTTNTTMNKTFKELENAEAAYVRLTCTIDKYKMYFGLASCHYVENERAEKALLMSGGTATQESAVIKYLKNKNKVMINYGCNYEHKK